MRFGLIPSADAEGAILAHAVSLADGRIAKGRRLTKDDVQRLRESGVDAVSAAMLDIGDLTEDEAAERLGAVLASLHVDAGPAATGRVNLFARKPGIFLPDRAAVDAFNAADPGITLATLASHAPVEARRMVATVKIIPLAVPASAVAAALAAVTTAPAFTLAPYRRQRVALIQTQLPGVKGSVLDKTRRVLEARLAPSGSQIMFEQRCAHRIDALSEALAGTGDADLSVIFGASAVIDRGDVIPAAVQAAGGQVVHLGMPVDPGNLLLLAERNGRPVLGAPGCARSPKENGFDWVLSRLLADLPVTGEDIRGMGVGGLLMEIASRPQPREPIAPKGEGVTPSVDIVILAAGRSSRMGGPNKLLATFDDVPLIRRSAETALASRARPIRVVVGHQKEEMVAALSGLDVEIVENLAYAEGLSTSLITGFEAGEADGQARSDGVLVMLADQPLLKAADLDRLIAAFAPRGPGAIVVATDKGRRGNPVVLSRQLRGDILRLDGDVGAKSIVAAYGDDVREVEIGRAAALDVDTPQALRSAGGLLPTHDLRDRVKETG